MGTANVERTCLVGVFGKTGLEWSEGEEGEEEGGEEEGRSVAGQRRPASLLLKAPSLPVVQKGARGLRGSLGGGRLAPQREVVGPGP